MKMTKLWLIVASLTPISLPLYTGCKNVPFQTQEVQTLKAVGYAGKAAIDMAWELRNQGSISEEKWLKIASFYDDRFQPTFRAAVRFAKNNPDVPAPLEIVSLLAELQSLTK